MRVRSSPLSTLNDDEAKRVLAVLERDFNLRRNEWKRIEEVKRIIQLECERLERATTTTMEERCNRCDKPFRRFFDAKERCSTCQLCVCHDCAARDKRTQTWTCKTCARWKELESSTGRWFYGEIAKRFKRCGSAKVVRELSKREKQLSTVDEHEEDLGYGTFMSGRSNSVDSITSYVIHDRNIKCELYAYSKRLTLLVDSLKAEVADGNADEQRLTIRDKESLKSQQQQITTEITRVRTELDASLRRSSSNLSKTYDDDVRALLVQMTERTLEMSFSSSDKDSLIHSSNFDQQLAQIIFEKYTPSMDSSSTTSRRQSQVTPSASFSRSPNRSERYAPSSTSLDQTSAMDDDMTSTESSVGSLASHRLSSAQRVDDWHTAFLPIETDSPPPSDTEDEPVESSWL